ncbi:MAG: NAD(P)/FAD-dependent oxidoreductase, partial [Myxococcota bacterium]
MNDTHDVIVIGAGPAGSTTAGLLAKAGHRVTVVERATFPRPRVGESLLPVELPVFETLGFRPEGSSFFKSGADFLDERTGDYGRFDFCDGLEGTSSHAYHVERPLFDQQLAERAEALGASFRFGVRATRVDIHDDNATVTLDSGDVLTGRYVVDATGRDRLLCRQHRSFERIEGLGNAAVWTHFNGLGDEAIEELSVSGNITVLVLEKGWGWVVPLPNGRLSTGFVSKEQGVVRKEWWEAQYAASPMLQRLTRGATREPLEIVGDYSFKNTQPYGARFGCVGDSSAFLDPVFSSGVAFAMAGAEFLVDLLSPALAKGREAEPELLAPLGAKMKHAYDVFGALIHSFYHTNLVRNIFFYDDPDPVLRSGFISVLAGDIWRDDNAFQNMLLRSARR